MMMMMIMMMVVVVVEMNTTISRAPYHSTCRYNGAFTISHVRDMISPSTCSVFLV